MFKKNTVLFLLFTILSFLYCVAGNYLDGKGVDIKRHWLFWNLFLAILPLLFAYVGYALNHVSKKLRILFWLLTVPWLLFLPNSCYMITDLIHLDGASLIGYGGEYIADLKSWILIIYLCAGIFLALLVGLFSTSLIHQSLKIKEKPIFNLIWVGVISLLVGYGVYIGRFLRLNSWDILHPRSLLRTLLSNINSFTILFSAFIAIFFFFSYLIFDRIITSEHKKTTEA